MAWKHFVQISKVGLEQRGFIEEYSPPPPLFCPPNREYNQIGMKCLRLRNIISYMLAHAAPTMDGPLASVRRNPE